MSQHSEARLRNGLALGRRVLENDAEHSLVQVGLNSGTAMVSAGEIIVVKVASGPRKGADFSYNCDTRVYIGSDSKSEICVSDDPLMQPQHVQLEIKRSECRVRVLAGRPLALVNGRRITQATLKHGDQFTVGETVFEVTVCAPVPEQSESKYTDPTLLSPVETPVDRRARPDSGIDPPPGYEIVRCIGQGSMGIVFEAIHKATQLRMAIKILHPSGPASDRSMRMFLREASLLSQLNHPRIVQFHELGWVGGRVFLAMEHVETIDVAKLLAEQSLSRRFRIGAGIVCQILDALHYAHSRRVVHRDVKPSNILVARDGKTLTARLSDFGLAKNFENAGFSGMTEEGETRGTLGFMAPEQFRDCLHAKPSADIYSAGVSLFYLLTGRYPFAKVNSFVERLKSLDEQPLLLDSCLPDVPAGLSDVLFKSMQIDPADRFRTAIEMRKALLPYSRSE